MIVFNGATGSLGAYFESALEQRSQVGQKLSARLERQDDLRAELTALEPARGEALALVHMAARVSVPECERDPEGARAVNVVHTLETIRTVCEFGLHAGHALSVVYVSSGHVYAAQPHGVWLDESMPAGPRSVYAHTKLEAENAVLELCRALDVPCMVARVFGLIAPNQPPNYLLPGLLRRIAESRLDAVPGLSFTRDYLDARDVCCALVDLAALGRWPFEIVNVCSARPVLLRDIVEIAARELRPNDSDAVLKSLGEAPARADDIPWIVGDNRRLVNAVGYDPRRTSLEQTVRDAVREQCGTRR
jgi:UDP-glucose 4-epimerase